MKQRKRVFVAGLFHETHTFLDETTELGDFAISRGSEFLEKTGDASPLGGALETLLECGWEIVPGADFRATPSGTVDDAVFDAFWEAFTDRWENGVDAVFLVLHGAMVTEAFTDPEGELLTRIRELPNGNDLPVFGVYDLHANFSPTMARKADALFAYRENPHTDAREAAVRAARALEDCHRTETRPAMKHRAADLIWDPVHTGTADDPMLTLEQTARRLESEHPDILAVNVNAGFAYSHSPDAGVSFQIITTAPEPDDNRLASLVTLARKLDQSLETRERPLDDVLAILKKEPVDGLTVLVEPSDNIGGGAPGDGTGLLRGLIDAQMQDALVCLNDPKAVKKLKGCGPGERNELHIGGKGSRFDEGPLLLEVELISRSGGQFELEDPNSHLASMVGDRCDMGPCAVVQHRGITLLLTSRKTPPFDLGQWRSQGIEPERYAVIVVKAAVAHRKAYDPITERSFWVDTPGPCRTRQVTSAMPFS